MDMKGTTAEAPPCPPRAPGGGRVSLALALALALTLALALALTLALT